MTVTVTAAVAVPPAPSPSLSVIVLSPAACEVPVKTAALAGVCAGLTVATAVFALAAETVPLKPPPVSASC